MSQRIKRMFIDNYELVPMGSASNYEELQQKPRIEGVELEGDKTFEDLDFHRITNSEIEDLLT